MPRLRLNRAAAEQAVQAAAEQAEDSASTASMLSEQDCQRLIETAKTAKVGDLTYCAYAYELEAFSPNRAAEQAQSVLMSTLLHHKKS